jgi:hypothetical protein
MLVHLLAAVSPYDDAYIIFRYVDNFLEGRGAVYNTGERVLGVSCPLYPVWLALLRSALPGVDLPTLAVRSNGLVLAAAGVLVHLLLRRLGFGPAASALAGSAAILSDEVLRPSIAGMESSLFLALLFGTLWALACGRDATAILLGSLSALARPEGMVVLAVVVAARYLDPATGGPRMRPLLGALPLVLWTAGATAYYGTPIPHSVIAKASGLYPLPPGTAIVDLTARLGGIVVDGGAAAAKKLTGLGAAGVFPEESVPRWPWVILGIALLAWTFARWWRISGDGRRPRALALPACLLLVLAFYALSNPLLMPWYIPLVYAPAVVAVVAVAAACLGPEEGGPLRRAGKAFLLSLVLTTVLVSLVFHLRPSKWSLMTHGATNADAAERMAAYRRTAGWIETHSDASDSVAAPEIGVLGYLLDRRMLDACGLVTPEALAYFPIPYEQRGDQPGVISVEFVRGTTPDFVVTLPVHASRSLLVSPWFASSYEKVHDEPCLSGDARYSSVLVFRRRGWRQ